jgi:hypothetical protein
MIHLNVKEKCLVSSETGEILRPECIDDLIAYHAYLKKDDELVAQSMLQDVFNGEKVISKMVEHFHKDINNDVYNYAY